MSQRKNIQIKRKRRTVRKKHLLRSKLFWMMSIVVSLLLLSAFYIEKELTYQYKVTNNLLVINKAEPVQHMLYYGGLSQVIKNKPLFYYAIRVMRIDKKIMPGIYALKTNSSIWDILMQLREGRPSLISITILSGWNFVQVKHMVDSLDNIIHTTKDKSESEIASILNLPYNKIEGLLYPDTYYLSPNQSDLELYSHAYHKMEDMVSRVLKSRGLDYLEQNLENSSKIINLPYKDIYSVITMASLIEKETGNKNDMPKIATVFINRLNKNMPLQDDPAVFYGLNNKKTITRADFKIDTVYNTYLHAGLPPSPICMPSIAAIVASVSPINDHDILYFVADSEGKTKFASSYVEHQKNIEELKAI